MQKPMKTCRICGKQYEACKSAFDTNVQRWQDIACCIEHGMEYFKQIEESRKATEELAVKERKKKRVD